MGHLLTGDPIRDFPSYLDAGGGPALETGRRLGPEGVLAEIRASGLRGRGGGWFPTGFKWSGLATADAAEKYVVCNAAEGEPGTFKDRAIWRHNPYQVIEGLAVAAFATGASAMYIGVKAKFVEEIARIEAAASKMADLGLLGEADLTVVAGPDDYLFGEEKALLEVIEGKDPLPRLNPPYAQGLFERPNGPIQPALVNNVETLANVPHIVSRGAAWYRGLGTGNSPGTIVCTVGGDVEREIVTEVECGTPLRRVVEAAGGSRDGRPIKLVLNGVSNAPIPGTSLDVGLSFDQMQAEGTGIGSAGFTVYDDTACAFKVALAASAFLYRGSCGQCPPCKLGTAAITEGFAALDLGAGSVAEIEDIASWTMHVTDANRCGLGAGQRAVAAGMLDRFPQDLAHHLERGVCPSSRTLTITTIEDWDPDSGRFSYSEPLAEDSPGG